VFGRSRISLAIYSVSSFMVAACRQMRRAIVRRLILRYTLTFPAVQKKDIRGSCCGRWRTRLSKAIKGRRRLCDAQALPLIRTIMVLASVLLTGCSAAGAPSYDLFGAFFPAWLMCGIFGIAGALVARVVFVSTGLANTLPYQLAVCTAIGVITALLVWLVGFGH